MKDTPQLSEPQGPGTSNLDWRYFEHNKVDRNELHIRKNSQKGTETKMAEKLNNFEKFEKKNFSPVFNCGGYEKRVMKMPLSESNNSPRASCRIS